ncbi:MAG: hypothetical protein [Caudoviricetes sp.]|nr:MAG: hypothetical protein [Caudoviricetes sp.]
MQKIKINATSIGREKPVVLPVTVANVKKTLEFQAKQYNDGKKLEKYFQDGQADTSDVDFLLDNNLVMANQLDNIVKYITDVLELTDEEVEKLNNASTNDVYTLSSEISSKFINPSGEEVEEGGTPSKPQQSINEH